MRGLLVVFALAVPSGCQLFGGGALTCTSDENCPAETPDCRAATDGQSYCYPPRDDDDGDAGAPRDDAGGPRDDGGGPPPGDDGGPPPGDDAGPTTSPPYCPPARALKSLDYDPATGAGVRVCGGPVASPTSTMSAAGYSASGRVAAPVDDTPLSGAGYTVRPYRP